MPLLHSVDEKTENCSLGQFSVCPFLRVNLELLLLQMVSSAIHPMIDHYREIRTAG